MSKKTELLKNTFVLLFGKMSTQLVALILLPVYTAFLSPTEFGFYDLTMTYVLLLAPILTIQMEMSIFRHIVEVRNNQKAQISITSNAMEIVVISVLMIIGASYLVSLFVSIPYFTLIVCWLIVTSITGLLMQLSRGLGNSKSFAIANILSAVTTLITVWKLMVIDGYGVSGLFIAAIVAGIVAITYLFISNKIWRLVRLDQGDVAIKKSLVSYALPLIPNSLALWVVSASDRTIITLIIDVAANGIYAIATKFPLALMGLFGVFNMSWTESLSLHLKSKDGDRDVFLSDAFNTGMKLMASMGLIMIAAMHFIFPYLVNEQFEEAYLYIPILVVGTIMSAAMSMFGAVYIANKMTKKVALTSLYAAVLNILLALILVPIIGLYGAAIGTALSFGAITVIRHYDLRKYINIKYDIKGYMILGFGYIVVSTLYYLNSISFDIIALLVSVSIAYLVNIKDMKSIYNKVRLKIGRS